MTHSRLEEDEYKYLREKFISFCGRKAAERFWFDVCFVGKDEKRLTKQQDELFNAFVHTVLGSEPQFMSETSRRRYNYPTRFYEYIQELTFEKLYRIFHYCMVHDKKVTPITDHHVQEPMIPFPQETVEHYFPFSGTLESASFPHQQTTLYGCPDCLTISNAWVALDCYESHENGKRVVKSRIDPFHLEERQDFGLKEMKAFEDYHLPRSLCSASLNQLELETINERIEELRRDEAKGYFHRGESDWLVDYTTKKEGAYETFYDWVLNKFNTLILKKPLFRSEDYSDKIIDTHWVGYTHPVDFLDRKAGPLIESDATFSFTLAIAGKEKQPQEGALLCAWEVLFNLHFYLKHVLSDWNSKEWDHLFSFPYQEKNDLFNNELCHEGDTYFGSTIANKEKVPSAFHESMPEIKEIVESMRHNKTIVRSREFKTVETRIEQEEIRGYELIDDLTAIALIHQADKDCKEMASNLKQLKETFDAFIDL